MRLAAALPGRAEPGSGEVFTSTDVVFGDADVRQVIGAADRDTFAMWETVGDRVGALAMKTSRISGVSSPSQAPGPSAIVSTNGRAAWPSLPRSSSSTI
jgi:hypothetical protein